MAKYYYFKPSGKWKYDGEGKSIPIDGKLVTHESIYKLNGSYPGIGSSMQNGKEYTIVIIDDESFPRMIPASPGENYHPAYMDDFDI